VPKLISSPGFVVREVADDVEGGLCIFFEEEDLEAMVSGGTRVEMFSNEFRARLSLIVSPLSASPRLLMLRFWSLDPYWTLRCVGVAQCFGMR